MSINLGNDHYEEVANDNTALSLLGLGLINAYEGNKNAMLNGFKLATDYNASLNKLIQVLIQQLPFYMLPATDEVLANPFLHFESKKTVDFSTFKPK